MIIAERFCSDKRIDPVSWTENHLVGNFFRKTKFSTSQMRDFYYIQTGTLTCGWRGCDKTEILLEKDHWHFLWEIFRHCLSYIVTGDPFVFRFCKHLLNIPAPVSRWRLERMNIYLLQLGWKAKAEFVNCDPWGNVHHFAAIKKDTVCV